MLPRLTSVALALIIPCASLYAADSESNMFHVRAGGQEVPLHAFAQGEFGLWEMRGSLEIEVVADCNVRWVDVRPRSAHVDAVVAPDHHTIRFRMNEPRPLTIEFNRDLAQVLHLFPYSPEKNPPAPDAPGVRAFGPGVHEAGLIELRSGETLYLAPGAWVKGNVRALGASHVTIRGRGVLDGSLVSQQPAVPARTENGQSVPAYATGDRNMIYLERCETATIEGITIFNSLNWTVLARSCHGLHVDGVNILNPSNHYGDDGFDLVSSSDVLLEDIFVRTNDDCVVVKNIDDIETRHIEVRHGTFWNMPVGGNGLEVGFELRSKGVSDVVFRDCDLLHVERGSAISIHQGDSGVVENIVFDDIRVEDARRKLIDFGVLYAQYGIDKPATEAERQRRMDQGGVWDGEQRLTPQEYRERAAERGHIRNVTVKNLRVVEGSLPYSIIAGYDDAHAVEDVRIEGLSYLGQPLRTPADAKLVIDAARAVTVR